MEESEKQAVIPEDQIKISNEEWLEIALALEQHHAVFYQIWQMGKPIFDKEIETAAVEFDSIGNFIWFRFNPSFWRRLDFNNKLFVICHEALHIILNHGMRAKDGAKNRRALNVAMDIVVNHSLIKNFGFNRSTIEGQEDYCWVDTVFKDKKPMPSSEEMFEYYYNLFDKVYGDGGPGEESGDGPKNVDDHSYMGEKSDNWAKAIDALNESLSEEEKESLKDTVKKHFQKPKQTEKEAGTGIGTWVFINAKKVAVKKKWETVIKRWSKKYLIEKDKDMEQWARLNRRLAVLPRDMFLPSEMEFDDKEKDKSKILVYFFMDTSGSCWDLKDRFFAAVSSLPPERFNVRLLCFDTAVQETTLASRKIYGGGGTSFRIMEDFIQKEVAKGEVYPEGIFVMTDGYGDKINPEFADRWHWFLTEGGSKSCIPNTCNFYKLEDYE